MGLTLTTRAPFSCRVDHKGRHIGLLVLPTPPFGERLKFRHVVPPHREDNQ